MAIPNKPYYLTQSDRDVLDRLLKQVGGKLPAPGGRPGDGGIDHQEILAPEVYIARTRVEIPALDEEPDTGTGSVALSDDLVSSADCYIYKIVEDHLEPIDGLFREVFNIWKVAIPIDHWILVTRDKFGRWIAVYPPRPGISVVKTVVTNVQCVNDVIVVTTEQWTFEDGVLVRVD